MNQLNTHKKMVRGGAAADGIQHAATINDEMTKGVNWARVIVEKVETYAPGFFKLYRTTTSTTYYIRVEELDANKRFLRVLPAKRPPMFTTGAEEVLRNWLGIEPPWSDVQPEYSR
jgi:hypothetical protein